VQEARKNHDDESAKQAIHEFDETIDKYVTQCQDRVIVSSSNSVTPDR